MTIAGKKHFAWTLMSGGFGAALLFALAVMMRGSLPAFREWPVYVWPVAGLALGFWGFYWLRRLYRLEPPVPPAAWTVSLTDFLLGMFCAGLFSALMQGLGRDFQKLVPVMGVLGLAFYLHGALAASLRGTFSPLRRPFFIVAHIFLTLGTLGVFTLALAMLIVALLLDGPGESLRILRNVFYRNGSSEITLMLRICVYALPFGWVMMRVMRAWERAVADSGT